MNTTAVLFDMDGLLIDSESIALRVFQEICDGYGLGDQFELYLRLYGTNHVATQRILEKSLPASVDITEFSKRWEHRYAEETVKPIPLMKGVSELLDYLEKNDIPKAVATSTNTERALGNLDNAGILHRFRSVTGGDQVTNGKPAPDIYLKAASTLDADPQCCLVLEDSPNGVKAGLAANMKVIQIPQLVQPDNDTAPPEHTVLSDLDAVISHLENMRQRY